MAMALRRWKEEVISLSLQGHGFGDVDEDDERPEKPRRYGVTEMRSPFYSFRPTRHALQEILDSLGPFVDGLKFSGGSHSLMGKELVREITDLAHKHDIYVSTGDWAEHLLRQGPSSFKQYVEECKALGFDTIELNAGSLKLPEEAVLRLVRLIKNSGMRVKPLFSVKFDSSDIPASGDRAFGAYIASVKQSLERVEDVDLLIRRAERCLEAGADMIMIDADSVRADIVAKIVGRLGLEKTMFEASDADTSRVVCEKIRATGESLRGPLQRDEPGASPRLQYAQKQPVIALFTILPDVTTFPSLRPDMHMHGAELSTAGQHPCCM